MIDKAKQSSLRRKKHIKNLIKKDNLQMKAEPVIVNPGKGQVEAIINLKRRGAIVELIEVLCPCGNKIEIACRYKEEE